ncbi:uncharacterized protein [Nicotiana sylvestris]|uniref:uncharacterized protein n=1 Tax=Nicotiana sylvestris TaxID=4096 RepID=UPI00388C7B93
MKKDIVGFIDQCLNCQQVKYEHQRSGGLLQRLDIPEWKWECITMDFLVGIPRTSKKFDVVWVIVDRLTKSAYLIPVGTTYSSERLAEIYICKIVHLHGSAFTVQSRQKRYADWKIHDVAYMARENILLKVSPMKGIMRFRKKGKLSPQYIRPFEVLQTIGEVAYKLALPHNLSSVHPVFHVFMLRKYVGYPYHVLDFSIGQMDGDLTYDVEPVAILYR